MAGHQGEEVNKDKPSAPAGCSAEAPSPAPAAAVLADQSADQASPLSLEEELSQARARLARSKEELLVTARMPGVMDYIKAHPGTALGAAALAGVIVGTSVRAREQLAEMISGALRWDMARRVYNK